MEIIKNKVFWIIIFGSITLYATIGLIIGCFTSFIPILMAVKVATIMGFLTGLIIAFTYTFLVGSKKKQTLI